ncbi:MAG: hypothetical protein NC338_07240 [Firmicutes bacterium]|nr:hypothetical protein [Bacillota bacterium]MCM1401789.1 hypothetical protein [Bacteroides sp.]MCM1477674.1 hypothetical protein [Bacteroides sp.]
MNRFTQSERRGTIAVLFIMAAVVIYLAVSRNSASITPETAATDTAVTAPVTSGNAEVDSTVSSPKKKKSRKSKRQLRKEPPTPARNPLSEPV